MNRREALKRMAAAGLVTLPGGFAYAGDVLYGGWVQSAAARRAFVRRHRRPFFRQQGRKLKGSGKGRVVMLPQFMERAMGHPHIPHRQGIGDCFAAGTLVTTADGQKPIEQVQVGDQVLTHKGRYREVLRTIRKPYVGRMVTLTTDFGKTVATPDHLYHTDRGWVAAGELTLGHRLHLTPCRESRHKTFDLLDYLPDSEATETSLRAKGTSNWVNRFVPLNEDLAYVLGAFLAEGSHDDCRVSFNLSHLETEFAGSIASKITSLFGVPCDTCQVPSKPTVLYVRVQSKAFATFIKAICPGNTYSKRIPDEINTAPLNVKKSLILGWLEGDGYCTGRKGGAWGRRFSGCGVSVSKELLEGVCRLLSDLGLPFGRSRQHAEGKATAYRVLLYGGALLKLYPELKPEVAVKHPNIKNSEYQVHGTEVRIKNLTCISKVSTTVYCLEVAEDASFSANLLSVHNCVSQAYGLGVDILTGVQIYMDHLPEQWVAKAATEIIYGGCRVEIGGGVVVGDGAAGHWGAEWLTQFGALLRQEYPGGHDFSVYDPALARKLGRLGCPDALEPLAKLHPVKTCTLVSSWEEVRDSVANGYPVTLCSNLGFGQSSDQWVRDSQGFLRRRGIWMHAMLIVGIDDKSPRKGACVANSWGDSFTGPTQHGQPAGSFWVDAATIDKGVKQGDSHALSGYTGYPRVDIPDYILW